MEQQKEGIPPNWVILQETETEEDALSLCDLSSSTLDADTSEAFGSPFPIEQFDFSGDQMEEAISSIDSILFCGRSIPFEKPRNFRAYEEQRSRLSLLRSDSFKRQLSWRREFTPGARIMRSNSFRSLSTSKDSPTAGTSQRRKYKAIIGVTKFPSKMEMSDIKKRQRRQAPAPLVPAAYDGIEAVVAVATGRSGSHWGLLSPLRCKSHLMNAFGRVSLSCIPHV